MRRPAKATVFLAFACLATTSMRAAAQSPDSVRRWSVFAGSDRQAYTRDGLLSNYEFGGTGDFRIGIFPLPLRATVAFSTVSLGLAGSDNRFGSFSLDAIARPIPKIFGIRPYFLGGLGIATRAPYTGIIQGYFLADAPQPPNVGMPFRVGRQNWAFAEVGGGLEMGRLFVQWKTTTPVASEGYSRTPISIGLHF